MTTMTKITRIVTDHAIINSPDSWLAFKTKITEMISSGKTIDELKTPDENTFIRYWADQESAQEWIDFVAETLATVDGAYTSAEILDNPDL